MTRRNDWKAAQEAGTDQDTERAYTLELTEGNKWLVRTSHGNEDTGGCVFASDERGYTRAIAYGEAYQQGQDVSPRFDTDNVPR